MIINKSENLPSANILSSNSVNNLPVDSTVFQEPDDYDQENLPELAEPYLPPYFNPSRYPTFLENNTVSNSTFEKIFRFEPTLHNFVLLTCLVGCTVWVVAMNLIIIGALYKGHKKKHHVTDIYLINLLVADVLLGIFVLPFMSIVIVIGYFPFSSAWCNLWVYFDYYLIISSSYGFSALMTSYLLILRWPEYYPRSRNLHLIFILTTWIFSNVPWTVPFINDRVFVLYPEGICGFSISKNLYFTLFIGLTGLYIPMVITLLAGIFAVKYLKQYYCASVFQLLLNSDKAYVHPFIEPYFTLEYKFNNVYRVRGTGYGLSPNEISSESTSIDKSEFWMNKKHIPLISRSAPKHNKDLQESVRKHFPLVATSLVLFVLCRSLFYTYFAIGSVEPKLFPPDLSHTVYWIMHSYAVMAPILHLGLDGDLREAVKSFMKDGSFPKTPLILTTANKSNDTYSKRAKTSKQYVKVLPKVYMIDTENYNYPHHHHHHKHHKSSGINIDRNNYLKRECY